MESVFRSEESIQNQSKFFFYIKNKLNNDLHFWENQADVELLNQSILITSHSDFEKFMRNFSEIDYVKKIIRRAS